MPPLPHPPSPSAPGDIKGVECKTKTPTRPCRAARCLCLDVRRSQSEGAAPDSLGAAAGLCRLSQALKCAYGLCSSSVDVHSGRRQPSDSEVPTGVAHNGVLHAKQHGPRQLHSQHFPESSELFTLCHLPPFPSSISTAFFTPYLLSGCPWQPHIFFLPSLQRMNPAHSKSDDCVLFLFTTAGDSSKTF